MDHKLDTDANLTIVFGNRLGKTVTLGDVNAEYKNRDCTDSGLSGTTMGPNTQAVINLTCAGGTEWNTGTLEERSSYSVIVDFGFTDPDSTLDHLDTGTLFGAVEQP